jgi:hypothetical protein
VTACRLATPTVQIPETVEQYIRPSSLGALHLCPGRAIMEARAVEREPLLARLESPQAKEGILGHMWVAQTLTMLLDASDGWTDAAEAFDRLAPGYRHLSEWTRAGARRCVSYAVALHKREMSVGWQKVETFIEQKLSGKHCGIPRGGTADLILVCHGRTMRKVVIQDHKLGFLDQGDAATSAQLAAYAVMAWDRWEPKTVEIHMAQGRIRAFTAATYDAEVIDAVRVSISYLATIARGQAHGEIPELIPSIGACRYCKALALCAAARRRIMHALQESALFGVEIADRLELDEDATLARRFAEDVRALQKKWQAEQQAVKNPEPSSAEAEDGDDAN